MQHTVFNKKCKPPKKEKQKKTRRRVNINSITQGGNTINIWVDA